MRRRASHTTIGLLIITTMLNKNMIFLLRIVELDLANMTIAPWTILVKRLDKELLYVLDIIA